jgi:hypothetical protein
MKRSRSHKRDEELLLEMASPNKRQKLEHKRVADDEFELRLDSDAKSLGIAAFEVYDEPVVHPYEFKTKVLLVKSGMCTQKTQAMTRFIESEKRPSNRKLLLY